MSRFKVYTTTNSLLVYLDGTGSTYCYKRGIYHKRARAVLHIYTKIRRLYLSCRHVECMHDAYGMHPMTYANVGAVPLQTLLSHLLAYQPDLDTSVWYDMSPMNSMNDSNLRVMVLFMGLQEICSTKAPVSRAVDDIAEDATNCPKDDEPSNHPIVRVSQEIPQKTKRGPYMCRICALHGIYDVPKKNHICPNMGLSIA